MTGPTGDAEELWTPDPARAGGTAIAGFARWAGGRRGTPLPELDYAALHEWSVGDLEGFWGAASEYLGVMFRTPPSAVLGSREMPGAQWFPGSTLNYAEHALTPGPGREDADTAVLFTREDGLERELTHAQLRRQVAAARAGLIAAGVRRGDRVAALAPNCVETLVMFLAAASLGAIWSSCSPEFGRRAVLERFSQIEPTVLLAVDGYRYGGAGFDIRDTVRALREQLPTVGTAVLVGYLDPDAALDGAIPWEEFVADDSVPLAFEPVPFDHPLWVLYTSGTTGLPKGVVHGHGGIVCEHLKMLRLQLDLGPGDRFFWFSTTGWMMWNLLIGGLLVGATVVLYDGSPGHPDLGALWRLAERRGVTFFGTSASYIQACIKAGLRPCESAELSRVRALGSTGGPLSPEGFRWVADAVGPHVQTCSTSGGTDVCSAFLGSAPTVPVWLGELSCAALGADVRALDERGEELVDEVGELVLAQPMPSMPVMFWSDPGGARLRAAYHEDYPGLWRHGDWVRRTPRGSFVIHGRSDSTLNRGGVRMGTADFYAVVEGLPEVADSLVVDTTVLGAADEGALLCFLVLAEGARLAEVEPLLRAALRSELSPRHVPDRFIPVARIPRTLNGKKCEVPVKRILAGADPDRAVSRDALQDPDALAPFIALAAGTAPGGLRAGGPLFSQLRRIAGG